VYWKFTVAPPAIGAATGVPLQPAVAAGVTAFAWAVPLFLTASVAVKACPVLAVERLAVSVAESAAAACTVTEDETLPVASPAPLFASVPEAEAVRGNVQPVPLEQPVYWKFTVAPPAIGAATGVPLQPAITPGVTAFAWAVPLFLTASVAVNACPVLTVAWLGVSVAERAAAACTVTDDVTFPVAAAAPLFASVPEAEAVRGSVPPVPLEQPVYWKFTVAPPPTAAAAGVPVQPVTAAGVTAFAWVVPLFLTASVAVNTWPVLTVAALGVKVPASAAAVWTATVAVAVFVATVRPLLASVPLAEALRLRVPTAADEHPV
jgi:uncharacterized membrane protein